MVYISITMYHILKMAIKNRGCYQSPEFFIIVTAAVAVPAAMPVIIPAAAWKCSRCRCRCCDGDIRFCRFHSVQNPPIKAAVQIIINSTNMALPVPIPRWRRPPQSSGHP